MDKIIKHSKKEILKIIFEIENLDLNFLEIDEIRNSIKSLLNGYTLSTPNFWPRLILFRGIKYNDKPHTLSELSYPPKGLLRINRANRENYPMFYCATAKAVPFFELGVKSGDKLVISKWKTSRKLLVNNVGYTDDNFTNLKSNRPNQNWQKNKGNAPDIVSEENKIIQNFLAKSFSQIISANNLSTYKLTVAIAEELCSSNLFEGLLYPTIQMNANADNFVIKPSFIDSGGLVFQEVEFICVKDMYDFKYDFKILDWANSISKNGNIEWKGRLPHWVLKNKNDELMFIFENNKWIAKDNLGNIIEPK